MSPGCWRPVSRSASSSRTASPGCGRPIAFCAFALGSFGLLTLSLKKLDVGPAYAVWTGIGAAGTAIYGMVFLDDVVSTLKIVSICLVIVGVIGLPLSGAEH